MDYKQILLDYLTKTLGKSNEEVQAILYKKADDGTLTDQISESALHDLEELHAQHLEAAPADKLKSEYDRGHKAGTFDAKSKIQEHIKKVHGIEDKTAEGAIAKLATKSVEDATTEDKVKTHPIYLNRVNELENTIEAKTAEFTAQLQEVQTVAARRERFSNNLPKIEAAMAEMGVVMPVNPTAAATLKRVFLEQVQQFDFDSQETGTYLKKVDGTLEKDKHGNPVKLEAYVKEKAAEYFDVAKQPARQSPGNDAPGDAPAPQWTEKNLPNNDNDFIAAWNKMPNGPEKVSFAAAYEAAKMGQPAG